MGILLMDEEKMVPIDFYIFCTKCKYYDFPEREDPCFGCLSEPYGRSRIPTKYEENKV